MSSPNLHLPILGPYMLGEVMSSHDGVTCYPAIRRGTDEKYILKVIAIPASQSKLDALLLAGALSGKEAAMEYFMSLSKDVINQTDILRDLSHQEGFVPYLEGHIQPMEGDVGYHVYLIGTYKQSLDRILRSDVLTHADAAALGLDLCAALAASRRTGYLYVDLKPGNIFRDAEQGFRIGDVGFIALSSLKYASLPNKYRSSYTAPELADDMAVVNTTADIYALGLVLYQAYNGGVLPFEGPAPSEELPCPIYADYEMAEIILKACHPDPKQRWQDPTQMAQALIAYLQAYGAPESPIIPPVLEHAEEEPMEEDPFLPEADPDALQQEIADLENADPDELAFMSGLVSDETAPSEENAANVPDDILSEELSMMLAQVDELVDHVLPAPPVAPDPVFAPMPEPILPETEAAAEEESAVEPQPVIDLAPGEPDVAPAEVELEEEAVPTEPIQHTEENGKTDDKPNSKPIIGSVYKDSTEPPKTRKAIPAFVWRLVALIAVAAVLAGGWFYGQKYYQESYLLTVDDLILTNDRTTLTVQVVSQIDDALLTVICTDSYGNSTTSPVINGIATFTRLNANTRYTVKVEANGHHKLTGKLSDSFTTPILTKILSFTAGMGPQDCSVVLNFTVSGPDSNNWSVICSADGLPDRTIDFSGRSVVITDLVAGSHYTFTLTSRDGLYITGENRTEFVATNILYATDLSIIACGEGTLTAVWGQPTDGTVTQWRVRCYNESGYNVTITTSDLSYTFTGLEHSTPCTVEVTAVGMDHSVSTTIEANPITIDNFLCDVQDLTLYVAWTYLGQMPEGGWILRYTINDSQEQAVLLEKSEAHILAIPDATYRFHIETADGRMILADTYSHTITELTYFSGYQVTAENMDWHLCRWPSDDHFESIPEENFTTNFYADEKAGFVVVLNAEAAESVEEVALQFVLHDANGIAVRMDTVAYRWSEMWNDGVAHLPICPMPEAPGAYVLSIYMDGQLVHLQDFSVLVSDTNEGADAE